MQGRLHIAILSINASSSKVDYRDFTESIPDSLGIVRDIMQSKKDAKKLGILSLIPGHERLTLRHLDSTMKADWILHEAEMLLFVCQCIRSISRSEPCVIDDG